MIIVQLMGGLGNQMFQFAAAKRLAIKRRTQLKLDLSFLMDQSYRPDFTLRHFELGIFDIKFDIATTDDIMKFNSNETVNRFFNLFLPFIPTCSIYSEQQLTFDHAVLSLSKNTYLSGYFQSEKYFEDIAYIIRNEFTIKHKLQGKNLEIASGISKSNSVSIHIRRGDYVTNSQTNKVHGVCSIQYYHQAINYIQSKVSDPKFFLFSDDPDWVTKNFKPNASYTYVTQKESSTNYEDLMLMTLCKHNIIANSSFSWWGAWLNNHPDKIVIAPEIWFADAERNKQTIDLIPDKWIRI